MNLKPNEVIKKYRKVKGLSQKELGELVEVSEGMVSQYESGKASPAASRINKIADVLGINPLWLIVGQNTENLEDEKIIQFPESFTTDTADTARQYLRHMGVVAFSGRDYTTRSDEEVVKMANFIRQQELNMQQSFNSLFGDDD